MNAKQFYTKTRKVLNLFITTPNIVSLYENIYPRNATILSYYDICMWFGHKMIKMLTCLLAKTSNTASLSSSSFNILFNSSLASPTLSRSLLSTTKISPKANNKQLTIFVGRETSDFIQVGKDGGTNLECSGSNVAIMDGSCLDHQRPKQ